MSEDAAQGEAPFQLGHQPVHGFLLFGRSGVGRLSANVQPSLIADADAVGVEAFGMCAHLTKRSAVVHGSIPTDVVVVATTLPASSHRAWPPVRSESIIGDDAREVRMVPDFFLS